MDMAVEDKILPADFSPEEIQEMLDNLDAFSPEEQAEIFKIASVLEERKQAAACYNDLIEFCKHMQPDYLVGKHHRHLANLLMAIAEGRKDRVCVNMPPRHGKSQLVSIYFPAWFIGKYPNKKILMVSHTADLAVDFGRKVRNIIDSDAYRQIFPTVSLAADSKSAGRWNTNVGGEFYACGIGSALAGRGADLLLVDDPHNEQDILNGNYEVFDRAYEWFAYGARTRLMPGGRVAIVQCMTGDTPVLMANGREKRLDQIVVGEEVATYNDGNLTTSTVLNHRSNGLDYVFTIKTTCGKVVRANGKHPFLVTTNGELRWVQLKDLRVGDTLVSLKDVRGPQKQKLKADTATLAPRSVRITGNIQTPLSVDLDIGASTQKLNVVSKAVQSLQNLEDYALHTITKLGGKQGLGAEVQKKIGTPTSSIDTASLWKNITGFLRSKVGYVLSASSHLPRKILARTGTTNFALTTATTAIGFGRFYVMTATSQSGIQKQQALPLQSLNTSDFTTTQIKTIRYVGKEEVFDLQVAETENFIANGLVSHNTRWHLDDLTGRVTRDMAQNEQSDQYEIVEFPAILDIEKEVTETDPDTNKSTTKTITVQKPLWPEFFDLAALLRTKASMPVFQWNAQYQQNPTAEEAALVKREWWNTWTKDSPPACEFIITTLDAAAETNNRSDFTAITTWGVFFNEEREGPGANAYNIILLNAVKKRVEFPELKTLALQEYKEMEPDTFIVEKKSSGTALYQELRRIGIPVAEYTPHRGSGDKTARLNSVSDIVKSGLVWVPQTRWAEEVVEEIAAFPFAPHDDLVDTTTMALMRFRQGGFIRLPTDEPEEVIYFKSRKRGGYY